MVVEQGSGFARVLSAFSRVPHRRDVQQPMAAKSVVLAVELQLMVAFILAERDSNTNCHISAWRSR